MNSLGSDFLNNKIFFRNRLGAGIRFQGLELRELDTSFPDFYHESYDYRNGELVEKAYEIIDSRWSLK